MTLIEGVRCKRFPVFPYFFEDLGVVSALLTAGHKFTLKMVHFVNELLAHSLAQGIAFAACKAGQQSRQEHDLFLIHGNSISIFEIHLHLGDGVLDRRLAMFTLDKIGNVLHRPRTIQSVHSYEVFERRRL